MSNVVDPLTSQRAVRVLLAALCLTCVLLGVAVRNAALVSMIVPASRATSALPSPTWPATTAELLANEGLNARAASMVDGLAPVVSDAETRRAIVQWTGARWGAIHEGGATLRDEAVARHYPLGLPKGTRCYLDPAVGWVTTETR